jgi:hypothetical protein
VHQPQIGRRRLLEIAQLPDARRVANHPQRLLPPWGRAAADPIRTREFAGSDVGNFVQGVINRSYGPGLAAAFQVMIEDAENLHRAGLKDFGID